MFLRTESISNQDKELFSALIEKGVQLQIVIFEDENGDFEYPVYLAIYNGKPCHFHYIHTGNENTLNQTLAEVWNYVN